MKTAAIIQARMGSTRLPGKTNLPMYGTMSVLEFMVQRVKRATEIDQIIIATTDQIQDEVIRDAARKWDVECYAGSEDDVLGRVYEAAYYFGVDTIVDLTGDCPFIDGNIIDVAVKIFNLGRVDYVSNTLKRTFPDGLDVQVYSIEALDVLHKIVTDPKARDHTGWNVSRYPEIFMTKNWEARGIMNWPELGITLDTREDLEMMMKIIMWFSKQKKDPVEISCFEIIQLLKKKPELITNESVMRKTPGQGE